MDVNVGQRRNISTVLDDLISSSVWVVVVVSVGGGGGGSSRVVDKLVFDVVLNS